MKTLADLGDMVISRPRKMIVGRLFRIGIVGKFHPRFLSSRMADVVGDAMYVRRHTIRR
jgi:hypothetical protein